MSSTDNANNTDNHRPEQVSATGFPHHTEIVAIAAHDLNRLIGNQQKLPWHLSADLKHFRMLTWGHKIIMGSTTFAAIGKPLEGRINIVVSRNMHPPGAWSDNLVIVRNLQAALDCDTDMSDGRHNPADITAKRVPTQSPMPQRVFIIGGQQIYQQSLHLCQKLYITLIKDQFHGDAWFPSYDLQEWQCTERQSGQEHDLAYEFLVYRRIKSRQT